MYHKYEEIIRFSDVDAAGICYFSRYGGLFDESIIDIMRKEKISWEDRIAENMDFMMPVVEQKVNYHSPLRAGDRIYIYTAIIQIDNKYYRSVHKITRIVENNEIKVASGYIGRVIVDFHTFKPKQIPDLLKDVLNKYLVNKTDWDLFIES